MKKILILVGIVSTIQLSAGTAFACSLAPSAYDLETFLSENKPAQVVFVGKVVALEEFKPPMGMLSSQNVQFQALETWRGDLREPLNAKIGVYEQSDMGCSGISNLRMKIGEIWLVVGIAKENLISLSALKSKILADGVVPGEMRRILDKYTNSKSRK